MDTKNENTSQNTNTAVEDDLGKMNLTQMRAKVIDLEDKLTNARTNLGALIAEVEVLQNQLKSGLTDEELAKKGLFPRGSMITLGLGQDVVNLFNDPTLKGKIYHGATAAVKVAGIGTTIGLGYATIKGYLNKRASSKVAEAIGEATMGQAASAGMAAIPVAGFVGATVLGAAALGGAICSA